MSEIFHEVASDQYAEKNSSPNTLHLGPSPSIISKRQLPVSSTIVRYTLHDEEIRFIHARTHARTHAHTLTVAETGY